MKRQLYILFAFIATGAMFGLGSCLKDPGRFDFSQSGPVIEFPLPYTQAGKNLRILNPLVSSTAQVYPIDLNIASPNFLPYDVTVNVIVDPNGIKKYIAIQEASGDSTQYIAPPASAYSFTPTQVVIPKGTRIGTINVSLITSGLDLSQSYILPLTISTVSPASVTISGNFGSEYLKIAPKNQLDGVYAEVGVFTRLGVSRAIENSSPTKSLATVNANTVATYLADYTNDPINLTVNADNTVTITPLGNTPALAFPGPNTYDPVNKIFTLNYSYSGGTRTGTEQLTYTGPNP